MNDIAKIHIIHDVMQSFVISDENVASLIMQIDNKDKIERFLSGYKVEDQYLFTQSALPWVMLLHVLQQTQFPIVSKSKYQVPDYLCIFESCKEIVHPILIEVKSVSGDKQNIELMKRQIAPLCAYAETLNIPLVFAIYWKKHSIWTHVPIDIFEEKKNNYKITLPNAIKADISAVFGDISFVISDPVFRKTVYEPNKGSFAQHEKYGAITQAYLSKDNVKYFAISHVESAIIDATIKMKEIYSAASGTITTVIEQSVGIYLLRLSNIMINHISLFTESPTHEYYELSRNTIIELMRKLDIESIYIIPSRANVISRNIYKLAFYDSCVWDNYLSLHKASNPENTSE